MLTIIHHHHPHPSSTTITPIHHPHPSPPSLFRNAEEAKKYQQLVLQRQAEEESIAKLAERKQKELKVGDPPGTNPIHVPYVHTYIHAYIHIIPVVLFTLQ